MLQNWSISTTVRSPERLRNFLFILQDMQGTTWDEDAQMEYQIRLIQARLYGAGNTQFYGGLEQKYIKLIKSDAPISFDDASSIFHSKKYKDGGSMRGRTSFNPLQKLGFVALRDKAVYITDMGKLLLAASDDYGDVLLRSLLKWQLPNPLETSSSAQNCRIKPFVGVLRLIDAVNKKWAAEGEKSKGLSVKEFGFFALNLGDWQRIDMIAESIVKMRQKIAKKPKFKRDECFRAESSKIIKDVDLKNISDYQDNAIRYFRMTKYFRLRGRGTYIDLEPTRKIELESLFKKDNAAPLPEFVVWNKHNKKAVQKKYSDYLGSAKTPVMPGKSKSELLATISLVRGEIKKLDKNASFIDVKGMSCQHLDSLLTKERKRLAELSRNKRRDSLKNHDEARELVKALRNLSSRQGEDRIPPSLRLEQLVSIALDGVINDAKTILPHYHVDDHGRPMHTASGGRADIECFYAGFSAICEVTMLSSTTQWMLEAQPIMRHLRDFEDKNARSPAYCLFIAPKIHRDSWNIFQLSMKMGYEKKKQRIVPMSIRHFCDVADFCVDRMSQNNRIRSAAIQNLFDRLVDSVLSEKSVDTWGEVVPSIIETWKQTA